MNHFGGKCSICGYNKCISALEFHHLDHSKKEFNISQICITETNFSKILNEAKKCILICNRCHREQHFLENEYCYEQILEEGSKSAVNSVEKKSNTN